MRGRQAAAALMMGLMAAACGVRAAPPLVDPPPEAVANPAQLAVCGDAFVLLDRRTNFEGALNDFLAEVRRSGCRYASFRVDVRGQSIAAAYNEGFSRNQALGIVRGYRRAYGLDWEARPFLRDPDVPDQHLRVIFFDPRSQPLRNAA